MVSSWWSLLREYTNAKLKFCQWTFWWTKIQYYNTKSETFFDAAGAREPLRTVRMKWIIHPMMHHFLHLIITTVNSFISSATYSDHHNNFRNQFVRSVRSRVLSVWMYVGIKWALISSYFMNWTVWGLTFSLCVERRQKAIVLPVFKFVNLVQYYYPKEWMNEDLYLYRIIPSDYMIYCYR